MPAFVDPSPDLLRRLRAMDARAEVIYVGEGRWWLGRVKPDSARRAVGRRMVLRMMEPDGFPSHRWSELRQARLMAEGFGLCIDMTIQGEPDGRLVRAFERFLFVERGGVVVDEQEQAEESARRDRIRENRVRERDLYRWLYRRSPNGQGNAWVGAGDNTKTGRLIS